MKKFLVALAIILLVTITSVSLLACVPKNMEKAEKKLTKAGYIVIPADKFGKDYDGFEYGLYAKTKEGEKVLFAFHFDNKDNAKFALELENKNKDKDEVSKQDGNWVYTGTPTAVKAFEK